ncbi:hypothetical protein NUU61_009989 [Penicillium alfredii]|uniref:RING-type domain-containing protein n=1 Tax=Penicillium alfredii TaxID=1506179 RepID=A0A9W9EHA8_9EURO|nr:uncharacterized protein NUU61_009989 [Penicillium alfredii]KAJ5081725.1 hypothetical protein NUU61_009989 [Penicillium alfredii]
MENAAAPSSPSPHPAEADRDPTTTTMASNSDISSEEEEEAHAGSAELLLPHTVVRLIQCRRCSRPLRGPLRLPCGNTVCRSCLPPVRPRTGVTYPVAQEREQGFYCHWDGIEGCVGEHCVGDCGVDVLLGKVVGVFDEVLARPAVDAEFRKQMEDNALMVRWQVEEQDSSNRTVQSARLARRGPLEGLYSLALEGRFPCDASDVVYEDSAVIEGRTERDNAIFSSLRDSLRAELDCQVCYALILDPLTTPCGHTFCRKCVARVLDHTDLCPICRRKLGMPAAMQAEPANHTLVRVIDSFFPSQIAARREAADQDETGTDLGNNLPLFVCTLSFPTMPTFLHIFEPRYRLMIRRVVEGGGGKFGMVMYSRHGWPRGERLGNVPFVQYGTQLMVERYELLPDGRSLVIATGVSRFKVVESEMLDGYYVAKTERVDDIPLAEEERLESIQTASVPTPVSADTTIEPPLESLSTQQLLDLGRDFITRQRRSGAPWLHPRVMLAYGPVPTDAARFPWWFGSILPISEGEKYSLLSAISVRERLKITARWARELEARDSLTPDNLMSLTPFAFSMSVSFGGSGPAAFLETSPPIPGADQSSETYIPQTLVVGAFVLIFFAQVGVNFLQVVRRGRRRRQAMELQFPQPLPQRDRGQRRTQNRDTQINHDDGDVPNAQNDGEGRSVP